MKEIKRIGFNIPSEKENDYFSIDSFSSLSEADIAIFYPSLPYYSPSFRRHEGKDLYDDDNATEIKEHAEHWRIELDTFVKRGGTLFIILNEKEESFIYSGTKDISGTGRNQKITHYVEPFSNYDFLPFTNIQYGKASGKEIYSKNSIYQNFTRTFKDYLSYKVYLKDKDKKLKDITFTTKKDDKILGIHLKYEQGIIIFLPDIEKHTGYDENNNKFWNEEGLKKGKLFINSLVEIDKAIRSENAKSPKPEWVTNSSFDLQDAKNIKHKIAKNQKEIKLKQEENQDLEKQLEQEEILQDLLFETGKPLENAVILALQILGYEAKNYDDGELELDQIITSPEGDRFIGECEGKENKDIDIRKFRQLKDNISEDFEKEEVQELAFGLLFGNAQRILPPEKRTLDFTQKCKSGAERDNIGLIKTSDLFYIARYVKENEDEGFAKKCREAIKEQLGKIIEFPEIMDKKTRQA